MRRLEGLDALREKVRERDNHRCQQCGKVWRPGKRRLDVHHLDPERESIRDYAWDSQHLDRLITLCHKCHLGLPHLRTVFSRNRKRSRDYERVYELRAQGLTTYAIAEQLDMLQSTVMYALKRRAVGMDRKTIGAILSITK